MARARPKPIRTIDDARQALKAIVGANGSVSVSLSVYETYGPGNRYESVTWAGSIHVIIPDDEALHCSEVEAPTPSDLVRRLATRLTRAVCDRAEQRRVKGITLQPRAIETVAVRRLEHTTVGG